MDVLRRHQYFVWLDDKSRVEKSDYAEKLPSEIAEALEKIKESHKPTLPKRVKQKVEVECPYCSHKTEVMLGNQKGESAQKRCPNCGRDFHVNRGRYGEPSVHYHGSHSPISEYEIYKRILRRQEVLGFLSERSKSRADALRALARVLNKAEPIIGWDNVEKAVADELDNSGHSIESTEIFMARRLASKTNVILRQNEEQLEKMVQGYALA
jgi:ssDNA-binding Zn-finger/Zn-ribbon topoisomerase 1